MEPPLPAVEIGESVDTVFADLSAGNPAVVVARAAGRSASSAAPTSSSTSPTAGAERPGLTRQALGMPVGADAHARSDLDGVLRTGRGLTPA